MSSTGLIICAYRRPDLLERLLASLAACHEVADMDVAIFVDGAKGAQDRDGVAATGALAHATQIGKSVRVTCRKSNYGLAKSVISAVTQGFETHDNLVVLEDDLVLAPNTLSYFQSALACMAQRPDIMTASAYQYPEHSIYYPDYADDTALLLRRAHSWGWAIRKEDWQKLVWGREQMTAWMADKGYVARLSAAGPDLPGMLDDWLNGRNDSWAVRMAANQAHQNRFTLYPRVSLVENTGFAADGTHTILPGDAVKYNDGQVMQNATASFTAKNLATAGYSDTNQAALNQFFLPAAPLEKARLWRRIAQFLRAPVATLKRRLSA